MSREQLEGLANEVFALRRRVVELEAENRELKMRLPRDEAPVPAVPATGFAFGIADAAGRREIVVPGNVAKLGSEASCNVQLPAARRMHAVIERDGASVTIIDLGTKEGTSVNGKPITKTTLSPGDRITVCDAQLVVVFR